MARRKGREMGEDREGEWNGVEDGGVPTRVGGRDDAFENRGERRGIRNGGGDISVFRLGRSLPTSAMTPRPVDQHQDPGYA